MSNTITAVPIPPPVLAHVPELCRTVTKNSPREIGALTVEPHCIRIAQILDCLLVLQMRNSLEHGIIAGGCSRAVRPQWPMEQPDRNGRCLHLRRDANSLRAIRWGAL